MYKVYIDENGYYTEGSTGTCVEVEKMPSVSDVRHLKAYLYDAETKSLSEDTDKMQTLKGQIAKEVTAPTDEERLDALESAMLDMLNMMGGGSNG